MMSCHKLIEPLNWLRPGSSNAAGSKFVMLTSYQDCTPSFFFRLMKNCKTELTIQSLCIFASSCIAQNNKQNGATKNKRKSTFKCKEHANAVMYTGLCTTHIVFTKLTHALRWEVRVHYTTSPPQWLTTCTWMSHERRLGQRTRLLEHALVEC